MDVLGHESLTDNSKLAMNYNSFASCDFTISIFKAKQRRKFSLKMRNMISSSTLPPICFFFFFSLGLAALEIEQSTTVKDDADKIRSHFLHLLRTRRSPQGQTTHSKTHSENLLPSFLMLCLVFVLYND